MENLRVHIIDQERHSNHLTHGVDLAYATNWKVNHVPLSLEAIKRDFAEEYAATQNYPTGAGQQAAVDALRRKTAVLHLQIHLVNSQVVDFFGIDAEPVIALIEGMSLIRPVHVKGFPQ